MTLQEIRLALEELVRRIEQQRRREKKVLERKEWTLELNKTKDLIDLIDLATDSAINL